MQTKIDIDIGSCVTKCIQSCTIRKKKLFIGSVLISKQTQLQTDKLNYVKFLHLIIKTIPYNININLHFTTILR